MKSVVILAAVAAVASAGSYSPLVNGASNKCIVKGDYDSARNEYYLTLGDCSKGVGFTVDGPFLKTEDGFCLSSMNNSGAKGEAVGLAKCKSKPSKQWSQIAATNQWKNGYKLCLGYDSKEEYMVQEKCQSAPLPLGSMQAYTFYKCNKCNPTPAPPKPTPAPPVPPPKPAPITCSRWSQSWMCPKGYVLTKYPDSIQCDGSTNNCVAQCCVVPPPPPTTTCTKWAGAGFQCPKGYAITVYGDSTNCLADGSNCVKNCCVPLPTTQKCGEWSVKNGGPNNACGAGFVYAASDRDICAIDGSDCQKRCCKPAPVPQQKCGAWSVANGGPINACGTGFAFSATDSDTCNQDGKNCVAKCCSETETWPCMSWAVQQGGPVTACPDGKVYTANTGDRCNFAADVSNCDSVCCGPPLN